MSRYVILDGPRGMVKSTLIGALKTRLKDDGLSVEVSSKVGILDSLVPSGALEAIRKNKNQADVYLIDSTHIYQLSQMFYVQNDELSYDTFSRAVEMSAQNLKADLIVLIDSTSDTPAEKELQRGYLWEAHQREYLSISTIGEVEPVFERICAFVKLPKLSESTKRRINDSKPTPLASIIDKKALPIPKTADSDDNRPKKKTQSGRDNRRRHSRQSRKR